MVGYYPTMVSIKDFNLAHMIPNFFKVIKVLGSLIILSVTIYLCFRNYNLNQELLSYTEKYDELTSGSRVQKTDTIYLSKSQWDKRIGQILTHYPNIEIPASIELSPYYFRKTTSTTEVLACNELDSPKPQKGGEANRFLADSCKTSPSFRFDNNRLSIYLPLDTFGIINTYKIDPSRFNYQFSNGKLTSKAKPIYQRLHPYIEFGIRPLNQLYDLSSGVSFETSRFNYNICLNFFYYPKFSPQVGKDIQLSIIYKF